jgi:hypothetical protein
MALSLHPFTIGQPHRIDYLDQVLSHLREHRDVWIATGSQIVDHYIETAMDDDLAALADPEVAS